MRELKASPRTLSVLQASGVWTDLQAACAALVNTDVSVVRSIMISARVELLDPEVEEAIVRYAEEQLLNAEVERRDGRLIVLLRRLDEGTAR